MAEHGLSVCAGQVIAEDDRGVGALEVLAEQGPALDEREPAQILVVDVDQVEGVEARCSAPSAA